MGVWTAFGLMAISFVILAKCADWLIEGAIEVAQHLKAPPMLIGIVIVGIGTTAPELAVSVTAALEGNPEVALGNAIGSVIYDDGIALPMAAFFAPAAILIDRTVLRSAAIFLIIVDVLAYFLAYDGTLGRGEGIVLVLFFVGYLLYTYWEQKRVGSSEVMEDAGERRSWPLVVALFVGGLAGVLISSDWIVAATPVVGIALGVPNVIIGLVMVALGTSIPEIATCIIAARKGQGSLAVGNILGADILNICWIAGASAIVNPLTVERDVINFMFPSMIVIVLSMLGLLRIGHRLTRWKGVVLMILCAVYLVALFAVNPGALEAGLAPH
ncbi:MAG: cation:H+ antiporter [Candidatus Latescibacterota bacterium]|jgi:cation:H+ antiporter